MADPLLELHIAIAAFTEAHLTEQQSMFTMYKNLIHTVILALLIHSLLEESGPQEAA